MENILLLAPSIFVFNSKDNFNNPQLILTWHEPEHYLVSGHPHGCEVLYVQVKAVSL